MKTEAGKQSHSKAVQHWKANHANRRAAQIALGNAVRDGRVVPWPVCAVPECSGKPEAHHPDYTRPLDVVWLCRSHHMQVHAMAKRPDHKPEARMAEGGKAY